jgi:hypothetical protein
MGLELEEPCVGCCGHAGSFGYEAEHYQISMQIAEQVLLPALRRATPDRIVISDGYSYRQQINHGLRRQAMHPAETIAMALHVQREGSNAIASPLDAGKPAELGKAAAVTLRTALTGSCWLRSALAGRYDVTEIFPRVRQCASNRVRQCASNKVFSSEARASGPGLCGRTKAKTGIEAPIDCRDTFWVRFRRQARRNSGNGLPEVIVRARRAGFAPMAASLRPPRSPRCCPPCLSAIAATARSIPRFRQSRLAATEVAAKQASLQGVVVAP